MSSTKSEVYDVSIEQVKTDSDLSVEQRFDKEAPNSIT